MLSFYRKYRPQLFSELTGQNHVRTTLINALARGRVGHGYLFAGPRGTGKTTVARLLAKALNCGHRNHQPPTTNHQQLEVGSRKLAVGDSPEPCNECQSCREIQEGRNFDVIEIDAASNRGIDEIRELREKIKFRPTASPYKVFIIDEVHMLTKEAFNALLKTLEEPPTHAVFILATTEVHKLPATILSRVQRFDFHRARKEDIEKFLERIIQGEKLKIQSKAIGLVAELADGSFRDAASLLEQLSHLGEKEEITVEMARQALGLSSEAEVEKMIETIFSNDQKEALAIIDELYLKGHNLEYFAENIIDHLRRRYLFSGTDPEKISSIIKVFLEAREKIKSSPIPQLPLELAVIELTTLHVHLRGVHSATSEVKDIKYASRDKEEPIKKIINPAVDNITSKTTKDVKHLWQDFLQAIKPYNHSLCGLLQESLPIGIEGDEFRLGVGFKFHQERLLDLKNRMVIEKLLSELSGQNLKLCCFVDPGLPQKRKETMANNEKELLDKTMEVFEIE